MDCSNGSLVHGVGGDQKVGKEMCCEFTLDCLPSRRFSHCLKPSAIPGEPALVLLGIDFLSKFDQTLIDWVNHKLLLGDSWVYLTDSSREENYDISPNLSKSETEVISNIIKQHTSLFAHNPRAPRKANLGHHVIKTKADLPHKDKVRRTPHKWKEDISQQIGEMLDNDIIRPSSSPYSSNILLTNKKDGTKRFCIDFRSLNKNTIKDTYPLPNVEDMIDSFRDCGFFTQVDLASGYWGIPVHPEDVEKTAFATYKGKFECLRMPFGLVNAQATFQRDMDLVKEKVRKEGHQGIDAYVDNIIIYSKTFEEHTATLRSLFHHL